MTRSVLYLPSWMFEWCSIQHIISDISAVWQARGSAPWTEGIVDWKAIYVNEAVFFLFSSFTRQLTIPFFSGSCQGSTGWTPCWLGSSNPTVSGAIHRRPPFGKHQWTLPGRQWCQRRSKYHLWRHCEGAQTQTQTAPIVLASFSQDFSKVSILYHIISPTGPTLVDQCRPPRQHTPEWI